MTRTHPSDGSGARGGPRKPPSLSRTIWWLPKGLPRSVRPSRTVRSYPELGTLQTGTSIRERSSSRVVISAPVTMAIPSTVHRAADLNARNVIYQYDSVVGFPRGHTRGNAQGDRDVSGRHPNRLHARLEVDHERLAPARRPPALSRRW